jgi:carbon storage regulator
MLVLTRRLGEKIRIGDVTLMVVELRGGQVKLGFEGAPSIPIHREEIALRIDAERAGRAVA